MTQVTGAFPYDIDNLLSGAARVILSDDDEASLPAIPTKLSDVIALDSPYAPLTGYVDVGATKESATYTRDISSEGLEIQQTSSAVLEDITDVERTLEVSVAEFTPLHLKILEESAGITNIAASAGVNTAEKMVKFGSIDDLTRRRVLFIGQRSRESGVVDEGGGVERGLFVALCLYNVAIAADSSEVELDKGTLSAVPLTFKSFPEGGQSFGQEHGFWLTEDAGTL